ncbi:hypothetical protein UFOVP1204_4 [uncultured Caudovirales phage]|uniref:Uncharacterized protein n=1 Tax=uncultured Caudovirales phage TaxID=2100421 RepID=A0A6J5Q4E9_9CAUD|nr:hypothetical protein UFOVP473_23 [uncultured Caudovirales phage]CAB4176408.1 hypothetical protein UFOVP983_23 [uncultured Caudovirales phage]CAB4189472.1 hypothetical protein UFOVP1204_4 [uncultured Caudovirales phage]
MAKGPIRMQKKAAMAMPSMAAKQKMPVAPMVTGNPMTGMKKGGKVKSSKGRC